MVEVRTTMKHLRMETMECGKCNESFEQGDSIKAVWDCDIGVDDDGDGLTAEGQSLNYYHRGCIEIQSTKRLYELFVSEKGRVHWINRLNSHDAVCGNSMAIDPEETVKIRARKYPNAVRKLNADHTDDLTICKNCRRVARSMP